MWLMLRAVPEIHSNPIAEQDAVSSAAAATAAVPLPLPGWRDAALLVGVLLGVFLALFRHTASSIGETWYSSRTFSHGFLILPMTLYLVWIRRGRLSGLRPLPNYWGLAILLPLSGVWLLAAVGDVRVAQEFALVAMFDAMLWTLLGTKVVRALWFPLAFLFFAVPFGESVIGPLQDFTAHFAVAALGLTRVPAILENRTIWVPSGPWVVAEACSGIRYLISSLVLGLIYASLVYRSRRRRVIFVLASVAVPIVANGLRAYGIILLAYLTDNRLAVGVDHIIYGWIFFTAIQLLLFSVGLRWRESMAPVPLAVPSNAAPESGSSLGKPAVAAVLVIVVISLAPVAEALLARRALAASKAQIAPVVTAPWRPLPSFDHAWAPLLRPSSEMSQSYASANSRVDLYLAVYSGGERAELVRGYNRVSNPRMWSESVNGHRRLVIDGQSVNARWDVIQSGAGSRLVWTWYCVEATCTGSPIEVKYLEAKARILGRPATAAVISLSTGYLLDSSEAASGMEDFLRHTSLVLTPTAAR
jgi:exosortase A